MEKRQSFSESPLTKCESCGGRLQKILQPTTIIYRGSGFYSTDHSSKSGGNGRNGGSSNGEGKTTEESSAKEGPSATKDSAKSSTATADKDS